MKEQIMTDFVNRKAVIMHYKGYQIRIEQDFNPLNPRTEFDNASKMVCFHSNYNIGDKHSLNSYDFKGWDGLRRYLIGQGAVVILPLYLYDHGIRTISTRSFARRAHHAEWDSGQVGFIYFDRATIAKEFGHKRVTEKIRKKLIRYLENEVKTYDAYLTGDVFGYKVCKDDAELDSCWGFYGEEDRQYAIDEAKGVIDWYVLNALKKRLGRLKQAIISRIPLEHRGAYLDRAERIIFAQNEKCS